MPGKRNKQPKGMSPKHARKAHVVRSSGNGDPIFCMASYAKYERLSPKS